MSAAPVAVAARHTTIEKSVADALAAARGKIDAVDARVLMSHVICRDAAYLIAHDRDALDARSLTAFEALVERRAAGEPIAYITGRREFYGLDFRVTPAVLIPRPETELLVELALQRIPVDRPSRVLDLGTGSGCVALNIATERSQARVTAADRSLEALAVASENACALGLRHIEFVAGDWFAAVGDQQFDVVAANPPYVAEQVHCLAEGDLRFEPHAALCGGADGLDALRAITTGAPMHLATGGWLLLEHGYDQGQACREMLKACGFVAVFTQRDLADIERVSGGRFDGVPTNR